MTPIELRDARRDLGMSGAQLAEALRLGAHGDRTVRRWEAGDRAIPGPAIVAIEALLRERREMLATPESIGARLAELKSIMVHAKVWPVKELREFLLLVRERERLERVSE